MKPDLNQTVREIAIEHPTTVRVFESLGIDYCCGGKRTLNDACERAGVSVQRALDLLAAVEEGASVDVAKWNAAGAAELIGHIVGRHHNYVRSESPRLVSMLEKVVSRHGQEHPELASIRDLFGALTQELSAHMLKEENILFPYPSHKHRQRTVKEVAEEESVRGGPEPSGGVVTGRVAEVSTRRRAPAHLGTS
jgi:regulator of cell morphogenesis and NO signaling